MHLDVWYTTYSSVWALICLPSGLRSGLDQFSHNGDPVSAVFGPRGEVIGMVTGSNYRIGELPMVAVAHCGLATASNVA